MLRLSLSLLLLILLVLPASASEPTKPDARAALKPFQGLVAPWKGTGVPEGSREEKQKGFWTEHVKWEWQFKNGDAWLAATIEGGRYFTGFELRPLGNNRFRLIAETPNKQELTFEGKFTDGKLTVERLDDKTKEEQRIVLRLLHANRIVYHYETRTADRRTFARKYQVGWTNQNEPFANDSSTDPECIVSGGKGTIAVMYKGKTYYVCCTGCRDEFKDNPEKYIAEFETRKKEKK